ncbi:spermine/spermidine synthase [Paenibacillus cellulosilyticus]|uniref:Polyamine aminopropyltransferase n=1 Tax=Paenibacillus cellulosilyticus TaxID=375489 RepID=A0A2V2YKZ0_9BACL|nr:spermidine synthase [Paenibacillus cellulosilyticus]PWV94278.1 spermine/spermidine synthase [Paenibacillus cellulosilyticus]
MYLFEFEIGLMTGLCVVAIIWRALYWRKQWMESYIRADEEPNGQYQVIMRKRSPHQKIAIAEHNGIYHLYAGGLRMLSTDESETQYAEALVHVPMAAAVNHEAVLIIGSGTGITAREVLRYEDVETITAVDLDPIIVDLGLNYEPFVNFTNGALHDLRVKNVLTDGRTYLEGCSDRWDVILINLPTPSSTAFELSKLYSVEFYRLLKSRLNPGGSLAIACPVVSLMPEYVAAVQATLRTAGFHVIPYHTNDTVEFAINGVVCLATLRPIRTDTIKPLIPLNYLSKEQLADMFMIPRYLRVDWDEDEVQTDRNTLLIDIVEHEFED